MTKAEVKAIKRVWNIRGLPGLLLPCMATRIPYNTDIDYEVLEKIGAGEAYLRTMIEEMYACACTAIL